MWKWSEAAVMAVGWRWRPQPIHMLFRLGKEGGGDERGNGDAVKRGETHPKLCAEQ